MRLIDADALKESLTETLHRCDEWIENAKDEEIRIIAESNYTAFLESILRVKDAHTIDAVQVIRCKDCKRRRSAAKNGRVYWNGYEYYCEIAHYGVLDDGFCFYGERKDDE